MKVPYSDDPDAIVRRIRAGLMDNDGCRITCRDKVQAEAIAERLTPLERPRVALAWADFPDWDVAPDGEFIERTHNALRRH